MKILTPFYKLVCLSLCQKATNKEITISDTNITVEAPSNYTGCRIIFELSSSSPIVQILQDFLLAMENYYTQWDSVIKHNEESITILNNGVFIGHL